MVLADGSILTASEKENTDLFWAVRGSGSNFGAVASFTFRAHPKPPVVCMSKLVFAPTHLPKIVEFVNKYYENMRDDSAVAVRFALGTAGPVILCLAVVFGPEAEAREYFSDLFAAGPLVEQVAELPYEKLNSLFNEMMSYGRRKAMGGSAFKLPLELAFMQSVHDKWSKFVSESGIPETFMIWEIYPNKKIQEVPLTDTSFASRGAFYNVVLVTKHDEESQDAIARDFIATTSQYIRENSGLKGERGAGVYANYIGKYKPTTRQSDSNSCLESGRMPAGKLFGPNMQRLLKLKEQYDPDNCFRSWHNMEEP
jgi:FAD/FMN-containing dehydrogenase